MLTVLEIGFEAVWLRAHRTLGAITLGAIGERVMLDVVARAPFLANASLGEDGLRCAGVDAGDASKADVHDAVRFALVELLTVLGNVTAEVLTPSLHAELARTQWQVRGLVLHRFGKGKK